MDFTLISKIFFDDLNGYGYEYKHISGLSLIFVQDANCEEKTNINITLRTPAINNNAASHVIEHCIASQLNKVIFSKQFARTYQDKTSYEYIFSSDLIEEIQDIVKGIFEPEFKKNKNIFLREGWRLEEKNNKLSIRGVVFDEIKHAFTSPIYNIISHVPFTLYNDSIYGNISGGILENILDLSYEDIVDYHDHYYNLRNCCIFVHGNQCIEEIIQIISASISKLSTDKINNPLKKQELYTYKKIPVFESAYPSIIQDKEEHIFKSINFAVDKPKNQFEYNIYHFLCKHLLIYQDEILIKNIKKEEIGKTVKTVFKNSLYKPYFCILFPYCKNSTNEKFLKISMEILSDVIENINIKKIPNFILGDIFESNNRMDGLRLGTYIMEAFFSDLCPFSYLLNPSSYDEKSAFIERLKEILIISPNYSIINTKPHKEWESTIDNTLLKKAIKNGMVNAYKTTEEKFSKTEKWLYTSKKISNDLLEKNLFKNPIVEKKENIQYFFYKIEDSKINFHIYFDITDFTYEELCLTSILSICLNDYLNTSNENHKVKARCYPIFDEKNNSVSSRFVIHGSTDENNLEKVLNKIKEIWMLNNWDKDLDRIKEKLKDLKTAIDIKITQNVLSRLMTRELSYFSLSDFHKDAISGIGFYQFLVKVLKNPELVIKKMNKLSQSVLTVDNALVSIYGKNKSFAIKNIKKFLQSFPQNKLRQSSGPSTNKKNEGFITSLNTNYMAFGFNYKNLGFEPSTRYEILCTMITHDYLFPILRNKYNVYGCELSILENNLIFLSLQDPNLMDTFETFKDTGAYIKNNINNLLKKFESYKYNYLAKLTHQNITPENDMATLKIVYPKTFKEKSEIVQELENPIRKKDIIIFHDLVKSVTDQNCYCVIGKEKSIKEKDNLFSFIDYLPIY